VSAFAGEPSAGEWLRRLAGGDVSSRELAQRCLDRLESANSRVNAVTHVDPDRVLADAAEADRARAVGADGALLGLPVTVKDSIAVAGAPRRCGSFARADDVPTEDATTVARARAAGAVVLAKTTTPEYMWSYETESALHGRTLNPLDAARTSGGSSGGEGALIGAGASPLGLGTDGGGSIRVPSHYCGIVGHRPSARLVPETGVWPSTRETGFVDMSTIGPMGRSVADVALLLGLIVGGDDTDPFVAPFVLPDFRTIDVQGLRIGFYDADGAWPPTDGTRATVRRAVEALEEAGAAVAETVPPPLEEANEIFFRMMAADGGARARADLAAAGGRHVAQLDWLLGDLAQYELSISDYFAMVERWAAFRSRMQRFVAGFDVVVAPVTPGPAPLHGCRPGDDEPGETYLPWVNLMAYSIGGLPVTVVPVASERGLPLGVQVIARPFHDHVALAAASAIEEATGGYAAVTVPLLESRQKEER